MQKHGTRKSNLLESKEQAVLFSFSSWVSKEQLGFFVSSTEQKRAPIFKKEIPKSIFKIDFSKKKKEYIISLI